MPKLNELKVVDLRKELDKSEGDSTGKKQVLLERLRQLLIQNDQDPDTFEFEFSGFERLEPTSG